MKTILVYACSIFLLFCISCNKHTADSPQIPADSTSSPVQLYRIFQGVSDDMTKDTVWLISYEDSTRISLLVDSTHQRSMTPAYNDKGQLVDILEPGSHHVYFNYDTVGRLTEVFASAGHFVFDYVNNLVAHKYEYDSDNPNQLFRTYEYAVTDGNITGVVTYNGNGDVLSTAALSYTTELNPFKDLSLFTYNNRMGTREIIEPETWFNKNLRKSITTNGIQNAETIFTFNQRQLPVKAVTDLHETDYPGVFTRQFMYK